MQRCLLMFWQVLRYVNQRLNAHPRKTDAASCCLVFAVIVLYSSYALTTDGRFFSFTHEDDTCYYTKIAENLFHGYPFTFDRINFTNGFHPLWAVVSSSFFLISQSPEAVIRIYFVVQYLLLIASAIVLYLIFMRVTHRNLFISLYLSIYFGVDDYFFKSVWNGMETPLFLFMSLLMLLILLFLPYKSLQNKKIALSAGLLMSLIPLSRIEGGTVICLGYLAALALLLYRQMHLRILTIYLGAVALPMFVFLMLSAHYCGSPVPVSGKVKNFRAAAVSLPLTSYLDFTNLYNWHAEIPERIADMMGMERLSKLVGLPATSYYIEKPGYLLFSLIISIGVYAAYFALQGFSRESNPNIAFLTGYSLASLCLVAMNKFVYHGGNIPYWYTVPFSVAQLLMLCYVLSALMQSRARTVILVLMLLGVVPIFTVFGMAHSTRRDLLHSGKGYVAWHEAAVWIRDNTDPDEIGSAFNAGIMGFYSERRIVNLDGLVNSHKYCDTVLQYESSDPERFHAQMAHFMRDRHVGIFADLAPIGAHDKWKGFFHNNFCKMELEEIYASKAEYIDKDGPLQAVVYRIKYLPLDFEIPIR